MTQHKKPPPPSDLDEDIEEQDDTLEENTILEAPTPADNKDKKNARQRIDDRVERKRLRDELDYLSDIDEEEEEE